MLWTVSHMAWSMAEGKQLLKATRYDGQSNWAAAERSLDHALDWLFRARIRPGQFVSQVRINAPLALNPQRTVSICERRGPDPAAVNPMQLEFMSLSCVGEASTMFHPSCHAPLVRRLP